jgi:hypothetical protein
LWLGQQLTLRANGFSVCADRGKKKADKLARRAAAIAAAAAGGAAGSRRKGGDEDSGDDDDGAEATFEASARARAERTEAKEAKEDERAAARLLPVKGTDGKVQFNPTPAPIPVEVRLPPHSIPFYQYVWELCGPLWNAIRVMVSPEVTSCLVLAS